MKREKSQLCKCQECSLFKEGYVPPQFPIKSQYPVLWVGQAGGTTEDITGVPFTGKAGKMLWRLMKEAGLDKSKQAITNVVGCVPPDDRKPSPLEISCCSPRLYEEIRTFQPDLIVALGDIASKALVGKAHIRNLRGQLFPLLPSWNYPCQVLCVLHPSFVMRQRQWIELAIEDFKLVTKFFLNDFNIKVLNDQPNFVFVSSSSELAIELEKMSRFEAAVDTETTGLDVMRDKLVGASCCCESSRAIAFDLDSTDPKFEILKRYLEDPKTKKITQNGQFDVAVLETAGIKVQGLTFDTCLASHIINSDLPADLDFLRNRWTSIKPYKPPKREMKTIKHWTRERRLTYGCWDALTTYLVAEAQKKEMTSDDWTVLTKIDIPLIGVINKMQRRGMLVDINALALLHSQLLPQIDEMKERHFDPLGLNPNSPTQLQLFLNIEDTKEDTLKKYIRKGYDKAELMQIILDYRAMQKVDSVYLLGVYDRLLNGRIHTEFNIAGTGTGRLSSVNPNLQNVPKELRVIYIADDEDHILIEGDYSQLEFRVVAVLANEQTVLNELSQGINIHHKLAFEMFHKQWDQLTDVQKLREKAVVFGTIGGRSARSIAIEFDIPTLLAEEWQALCFNKYPKFLLYKKKQTKIFNELGYATTAFGRKRILQNLTQAFNTPMQGSAGDITKTSLIELDRSGIDLRLTVHDSIVAQFHKNELEEGASIMKQIMERPIEQLKAHQFPVKLGAGSNWYELKEVQNV